MKRKFLMRAGVIVFALMTAHVWMQVLVALRDGQFNIGRNYWNAPIGAYSTLAVLVVWTPIGAILALRHWPSRKPPTARMLAPKDGAARPRSGTEVLRPQSRATERFGAPSLILRM